MGRIGRCLVLVGLVLLGHAVYSAVQHRSFLILAEEEFTGLPNDVTLECLLGGLLCSFGVVSAMGRFMDIRLTTELNAKSFETVSNRPSFMTFNHRGKVVYSTGR